MFSCVCFIFLLSWTVKQLLRFTAAAIEEEEEEEETTRPYLPLTRR
jgi:hypothetical protein